MLDSNWFHRTHHVLHEAGTWLGSLGLRAILAWEFWESGLEKYRGQNWFADIQANFPFPFDLIPTNISWQMATWFELLGAIALLLGLGTRLAAASLLVLTMVATAAVHWPAQWDTLAQLWQGYALTDTGFGNYKLPLIFGVMLWPLCWQGAGKLSLDHLLASSWFSQVYPASRMRSRAW